jgi:hypothetical protein
VHARDRIACSGREHMEKLAGLQIPRESWASARARPETKAALEVLRLLSLVIAVDDVVHRGVELGRMLGLAVNSIGTPYSSDRPLVLNRRFRAIHELSKLFEPAQKLIVYTFRSRSQHTTSPQRDPEMIPSRAFP